MGISVQYLLWLFPVLVATSLVMAATRHERTDEIIRQAYKTGVWTICFLLTIAAVLWVAMFMID
ncbi:MAG: hypothetical protein ACK5T6_06760 [Pirellula sp.]